MKALDKRLAAIQAEASCPPGQRRSWAHELGSPGQGVVEIDGMSDSKGDEKTKLIEQHARDHMLKAVGMDMVREEQVAGTDHEVEKLLLLQEEATAERGPE